MRVEFPCVQFQHNLDEMRFAEDKKREREEE